VLAAPASAVRNTELLAALSSSKAARVLAALAPPVPLAIARAVYVSFVAALLLAALAAPMHHAV
jgi:hypothetical protein